MAQAKMINKKIIIFSILFILLLVYFLIFEKKIEEKEIAKNNLFKYVIADVKKFTIEKSNKIIEVERVLNNWIIKKPAQIPGSKVDIDSYLQDARDLQKDKVIGKNMTNLKPYGRDAPKVIFKVHAADELLVLKLGDMNPDQSGYYAKIENQPEVRILETVAESTLDKELFYFRDKDIFKLNIEDIKECSIVDNGKKYLLKIKDDAWVMEMPIKFEGPEPGAIDIKDAAGSILDISIKKFFDLDNRVPDAKTGLGASKRVIKVIDNKNKIIILNIGKEIKDSIQYYARKSNEGMVFAIDKNTYDNVIADLNTIVEEKKKLDQEKKKEEEERKKKEAEEKKEKAAAADKE